MEQKKSISAPKKGLNRDSHISQLENTEYPFALNANTESETGGFLNITNEPSNYYGVKFPENYKVIGYKKDLNANRTYYFLTNRTTKKSSVGYVDDTFIEGYNTDEYVECEDCQNNHNELGIPLEEISQTPNKVYVELINDICLEEGEGLNLSIDFPIKFIEIKQEKLGTCIYWNDYKNEPRWINVSDLSYLFTIDVPCNEPVITDCIIIDKLLQFPHHSRIILEAEETQTGGNLKQGTYEFYAVYCDISGNELTNYSTPTNPISIFDAQRPVIQQTDLDRFTNSSIKIKVSGLDNSFNYYKIVCVERNPISGTQSGFLQGIHPTSEDEVIYSSSGSSNDSLYLNSGNKSVLRRVDIQSLFKVRPYYEKAKGLVSTSNRLFQWGLVSKEEMNLQPVVNLFSSLFKWQTSAAKESLYKNPIATSKYKTYTRDEVNAFGLRFFDKDGNYSPVYPLVGRPSENDEKNVVASTDKNRASIEDNTPNCFSTNREEKWQIYNTAHQTSICDDLQNQGKEVTDNLQRTCVIEDVYTISSNSTTLPINEGFTSIEQYISDNPNVIIPEITPYLIDEYSDDHCVPSFQGTCDSPDLISFSNSIGEVDSEVVTYNEKDLEDYVKSLPTSPSACTPYVIDPTTGNPQRNTNFENDFMPCNGAEREIAYTRNFTANNEDCSYAVQVSDNNDPTQPGLGYFNNYYGALTLADLLIGKTVSATDANYESQLHKGALWFKINKNNRDKIIFELTKNSTCQNSDDIPEVNKLRYSIFTSCGATSSSLSAIIDSSVGTLIEIDSSTYPDVFYVAVDAPIVTSLVEDSCVAPTSTVAKFRTAPPCGCFSLFTRDVEYDSLTVSWESITINKTEVYQASCTYFMPEINDCDPIPYAQGKFAYWESIITYPDNKQLYDSSTLEISPLDLTNLSVQDRLDFSNYYTLGINNEGNYNLNSNTNLTCQPQRFFKFPDNSVAPFMSESNAPFSEAIIYPLGITVDDTVIDAILNVAVKNNLISQKQRNQIQGWEILRGDDTVNKSVIANGLGYDMYKYTHKGKDYHYSNYPHNDLGDDILHIDETSNEIIKHPFGGQSNNLFSFLSPEIVNNKSLTGSEITVSGYQQGNARGRFVDVDKHPQWTILGQRARNTALILALAEVAFETATKIAEYTLIGTSSQWFIAVGGTSSGGGASTGTAGTIAATAIYVAAQALNGFVNVGKYRYEWLRTFRDLGTMYNFSAMNVSHGYHNRFTKNTIASETLRGLSFSKYLRDGRFNFRDGDTTNEIRVNNWLREESLLLSLGSHPIIYESSYILNDNNTLSPETGSRTIMSQNDCDLETEYERNIGSPYITLKNYVPDQWGSVDSIKWLTTNYVFNLGDSTSCLNILGGTSFISRFTWKKKLPIFSRNAMGLADKMAFNYGRYKNIGKPRFYCNYEIDTTDNILGVPFPDIDSQYNFDCLNESFYVKPESKQYLFYYGITDFLVESSINCNFRYGGNAPKEQFYPNVGDISEWVQPITVPISEPNTFYYNNIYSLPVSNTPYKKLDVSYDKEIWAKRNIQDNAIIYSEYDSSQNDLTDPWLTYKALNWEELTLKYGKLISLIDMESSRLLCKFENGQIIIEIQNTQPQNINLGDGSLLNRKLEFKITDLGFAGTQSSETLSTPFGHLSVDAQRQKVFLLEGNNIQPISDVVGNRPSGLKNWFREQLPFKILRYFPKLDIDNKFKSIGLSFGFDARRDKFKITKKDYIPINDCIEYDDELGLVLNETVCSGAEPVISCPTGYIYNSLTQSCEKVTVIQKCPEGYIFNAELNLCEKITSTPIDPCPPNLGYFAGGLFTSPTQRLYNSEITVPTINNGSVNIFKRDSLGRILVGGTFTSVNGISVNRLFRMSYNGIIDTSFNIGTGFNGAVNSIDIYEDGRIVVGGVFTSYNGNTAQGIVRIQNNGDYDPTMDTAVGFVAQGIYDLRIVENEKILVACDNGSIYKGYQTRGIFKLLTNGQVDTSFGGGTRFTGTGRVESIEVDESGRYILGNRSIQYNGITSKKLVRIFNNGDLDTSFNVGEGFQFAGGDNTCFLYKVQMQGNKILVSGRFETYKGQPAVAIARINPDGSLDNTFNNNKVITGVSGGADATDRTIYDFDTNQDREILLGGKFLSYSGNGVPYLAVTDENGFPVAFQDPEMDDIVITVQNAPRCVQCEQPCYTTVVGSQTFCNCAEYIPAQECGLECQDLGEECECTDEVPPIITPVLVPVEITDDTYFKKLYWTVEYKPLEQAWGSYSTLYPDYYVNHEEYYQTGFNDDGTLWNHTLNNSSFQVFRGELHPFVATYVVQNENINKILDSISINSEVRRYQNLWDYSQHNLLGFNKLEVYNSTNTSGVLNLFKQNSLADIKRYPKTNYNNTQDILYTGINGDYNINYFYNRVIKQTNNIPIYLHSDVNVERVINPLAVSFKGKSLLERIKSKEFVVQLTNDNESRFQVTLKSAINTETVYE